MKNLPVYQIEVFIDEKYLTKNEIANGENKVILKGIGLRDKMDIINNVLTHGVGRNKGTPLETIFPSHCISRIIVIEKK